MRLRIEIQELNSSTPDTVQKGFDSFNPMSFNDTSVMFIINNLATNHRHLATAKLYRIHTGRIVLFDKFMTLLECKSHNKESHSIGGVIRLFHISQLGLDCDFYLSDH